MVFTSSSHDFRGSGEDGGIVLPIGMVEGTRRYRGRFPGAASGPAPTGRHNQHGHPEDVGGHQHRIGEEAHVDAVVGVASGGGVGGDERLVGVRPVERPLAGDVRQQRADLRDRRARATAGTRARRSWSRPQASSAAAIRRVRSRSCVRVGPAVERVQVGDEDVASRATGSAASRASGRIGAGVVAEVQLAGRLDAGQGDGRVVMAVVSFRAPMGDDGREGTDGRSAARPRVRRSRRGVPERRW